MLRDGPPDPANRLRRFDDEKPSLLAEVERRVVQARLAAASRRPEDSLEYVLNDVVYQELRRIDDGAASEREKRRASEWRELGRRLGSMPDAEKQERLALLTREYVEDVAGRFDERVYRFARGVVPPALTGLLAPRSLGHGLDGFRNVQRHIVVEGPTELLRRLASDGTLVLTPTHSSNLDSVVLGWALEASGLPPVTYGAGKNLFSNRFISFFLYNLGAYRVDRRIRHGLYKDVLKEYSTVLLARGYHSLFFPGGTRSRAGAVERRLKLGLLGTTVTAYEENLRAGGANRRIYVVPVTLNYGIVLEAETLVEDALADEGKHRYIIEDDEFSRLGRLVDFGRKMLSMKGSMVVRFGTPRDPFGNRVGEDGLSRDGRGRVVDIARYVTGAGGEPRSDAQRDQVYTRELADCLVEDYRRLTVFLPTHLVARAIYDAIARQAATRDVYRLLRLRDTAEVSIEEVERRVAALVAYVRAHPEVGRVAEEAAASPAAVVAVALEAFGAYHTRPVAVRTADQVIGTHLALLYYYRNRTLAVPEGYDG